MINYEDKFHYEVERTVVAHQMFQLIKERLGLGNQLVQDLYQFKRKIDYEFENTRKLLEPSTKISPKTMEEEIEIQAHTVEVKPSINGSFTTVKIKTYFKDEIINDITPLEIIQKYERIEELAELMYQNGFSI